MVHICVIIANENLKWHEKESINLFTSFFSLKFWTRWL